MNQYGNEKQPSTSQSKVEHKFFERHLDNDLNDLSEYLKWMYQRIENGQLMSGPANEGSPWDSSGSFTTMNWNKYNALQFYHPAMHNLFGAIREMTIEACDHYGINFKEQKFYAQSWFNINYNHVGKLDWHEHGGKGAPYFHGYYCVNAEPSITHYRVFDKEIDNINKNNRAILSETGHPHAMADWDWDGPRITIAYDVLPLENFLQHGTWEQHWVPLS